MKNQLTESNIRNIIFLKGIKLSAWQISKILSLKTADVERIMRSKLYNKVPKKFDWKDFQNSMI
jgi:hypothetical protein